MSVIIYLYNAKTTRNALAIFIWAHAINLYIYYIALSYIVRRYREKRRRRANKPKWFCHLSEHSLGCSSYIILYSVGAAAFDWSCTTLLCSPQYSQPSSCIIIYISSFVLNFFFIRGLSTLLSYGYYLLLLLLYTYHLH